MKYSTIILSSVVATSMLLSCKKSEDILLPEEEVITTLQLTFTNTTNPLDVKVCTWEDLDGAGGNAPNRIDTIALDATAGYNVSVKLFNASVSPIEDITVDIESHKDEHQFFYTWTPDLFTSITYTDKDSRNLPVGLTFSTHPRMVGTGTFTVSLSHFEDSARKDGTTQSDETDITTTFPVIIR